MNKVAPPSLHDKILAEITGKIQSGAWGAGFRIPFETELAAQFGVSRMTVNKVLTQLTRDGVLERRRKLGTIVCLPRVESAVLEIADIEQEVQRLGLRYSFKLLARGQRPIAGTEQRLFPLEIGSPILALHCLHFADALPFCNEERLINLGAVPESMNVDFASEAPGHWLLRKIPWRSAKHKISATNASVEMAKLLGIKVNSACLTIDRLTEFNSQYVTHVRLTYPGDRHQMVAQFSPRQG